MTGVRDDLTSPQALPCIHKSQGRQRRMGNLQRSVCVERKMAKKPNDSWSFNLESKPKSDKQYNFDLCRLVGYTPKKSEFIVNITSVLFA